MATAAEVPQVERGAVADALMGHEAITESSRFPLVRWRNQPERITRRIDADRYEETCVPRHEKLGHRYSRIRYRSLDGVFVEGVVAVPEGFDLEHRYPAVIYNRGNWEEGRRFTFCFTGPYELWARRGFVVLGSQYRGTAGSEGTDEWGGADVHDVLALTEIARELPFVDPDNVFMAGSSRGGMMTYMALKRGARVNAAVADCAVAEVHPEMSDDNVARVVPTDLEPEALRLEYEARSALAWPEALTVPILIMHGAKDAGVPVQGAQKLSAALTALGRPHELVVYPEAGHCGENYPDSFVDDLFGFVDKYRVPPAGLDQPKRDAR